jgi:hypothetical protein
MQGIAARAAVGQASSAQAKRYAGMFIPTGMLAADTLRELEGIELDDDGNEEPRSKL